MNSDPSKGLKEPPWYISLALDVIFLRSTPATATVYGIAWAVAIAFVCLAFGAFTQFGIPGFERTGEAAKVKQQLQWFIGNDAGFYYSALCRLPDSITREQMAEHYTRLQAEYKYVSGGQEAMVEPCPPKAQP